MKKDTFMLWVDDTRKPKGIFKNGTWCQSVNIAILLIDYAVKNEKHDEYVLSLDNDAGNFYEAGGDYIKILDYIEEHFPQIAFTINIHTANPVARNKMIKICKKNNWKII